MGLFDALKGAVDSMTGGAAHVTVEYAMTPFVPGQEVRVIIRVTSTGGQVNSNGVFLDIWARETGRVHVSIHCSHCGNNASGWDTFSETTYEAQLPVSPPFTLGAGQGAVFEARFGVPGGVPGTYQGVHVRHEWLVRGRLDAFGNDPDSGFHPIRVVTG